MTTGQGVFACFEPVSISRGKEAEWRWSCRSCDAPGLDGGGIVVRSGSLNRSRSCSVPDDSDSISTDWETAIGTGFGGVSTLPCDLLRNLHTPVHNIVEQWCAGKFTEKGTSI